MVRVAIVAPGGRGDVAPYAGLGVRLQEAGHRVVLATDSAFEAFVLAQGLGHHRLPSSGLADAGSSRIGSSGIGTGIGSHGSRSGSSRLGSSGIDIGSPGSGLAAMLSAARDADVLLLTPGGRLGVHVAEGLGMPSMGLRVRPPGALHWGDARRERAAVASLRRELGLAPLDPHAASRRWPVCDGYSPIVVPPPADRPAWHRTVGYWWPPLDLGFTPSPCLLDFLASGPPPVYIGLRDAPADLILAAVRKAGLRAIVQTESAAFGSSAHRSSAFDSFGPGSSALGSPTPGSSRHGSSAFGSRPFDPRAFDSPGSGSRESDSPTPGSSGHGSPAFGSSAFGDDVHAVGEVPHEWLFPQMAAVVHRAGAGTTAAGVRAGIPAVPVPGAGDEPFWAERLTALGVTPGPIPRRRLTAARLATALTGAVADPVYRHRAEAIAVRLSTEDGAAAVGRILERL